MPVDKFGKTETGSLQRFVSGGVTLSQVNNTFLRRDGGNTFTRNINMDSHKFINLGEPADPQDGATRSYVDKKISLPFKRFVAPYATDINTYKWKDYQGISPVFSESEFDELPAGHYACYTGYFPATRLGNLPTTTKGYLITLTYQQPVDRNKYYKWINSTNGEEWEAYFKNSIWNTWVKNSKVSKAGDTMTGNLSLNVGDDVLRTLGCSDLSGSKGFAILLGSIMNQIQCQLNVPITLHTTNGFLSKHEGIDVIKFGKGVGDHRTEVYQDVLMNQHYISNLHDPDSLQDAATKSYADKLTKKSYSGFIPVLEADTSILGFGARASSIANSNTFNPYGAFNNFNADGSNGSWVSNTTTGWLQIKCPYAVQIWRVALKARSFNGRNITAWNITARNEGTQFTPLVTSTTALLGSATSPSFFDISTTTAYQYYRFNITASTGSDDVGVQVMQLFVLSD